jgi:hypothetical protein
MLILATTDQFGCGSEKRPGDARDLVLKLRDKYERRYYGGIICERWVKAQLRAGAHPSLATGWFLEALDDYEAAQDLSPPGIAVENAGAVQHGKDSAPPSSASTMPWFTNPHAPTTSSASRSSAARMREPAGMCDGCAPGETTAWLLLPSPFQGGFNRISGRLLIAFTLTRRQGSPVDMRVGGPRMTVDRIGRPKPSNEEK